MVRMRGRRDKKKMLPDLIVSSVIEFELYLKGGLGSSDTIQLLEMLLEAEIQTYQRKITPAVFPSSEISLYCLHFISFL